MTDEENDGNGKKLKEGQKPPRNYVPGLSLRLTDRIRC